MMNPRIYLAAIWLMISAVTGIAAVYTPQQVPNVHVQDRTQYVSNPDGILSAAAVTRLNTMLDSVWNISTAEPVVVAIDDMAEGYDEVTFANELYKLWGIGKKDKHNGLLILIVKNPHRWTVRTGYGAEGVLTDGTCGSIMRHHAVPAFRNGDYDGGVIAATKVMADALTDPEAADVIRSKYSNNSGADKEMELFPFWIRASVITGIVMLIWVLAVIVRSRGKSDQERYRQLNNIKPVALFLSFLCLGIPAVAYAVCALTMNRLRNHRRKCPNCGAQMKKLDEATDNNYLTPAQDMEERINSIDYDVWLCPECGEKDVIPYVNKQSSYSTCANCGARTCTLSGNRIIQQPTTHREGRGERIYSCRNCGAVTSKPYTIAKLATPIVIVPGGFGGRGGGGFGGGMSGGSFGGGITGGGGASGGW